MADMIMAAFPSGSRADAAIDELASLGYAAKDISVIGSEDRTAKESEGANSVLSGAAEGAATGGIIGGIAGLLAGAGVIPALAGLLIGGPIAALLGATGIAATTISGAVTGAAAGGLVGALINLGVPEETAQYYETTVREGGVVVGVPVRDGNEEEVRTVLDRYGAREIETVTTP